MFFLLGDDGGFCYETFGALVKALNAVLLSTLTSSPLSLFFLAETYQDRKTRSMDARDKKNTTTGEPCDSGPAMKANHWVNGKDRNALIKAVEKTTNHSRASCFIRSRTTSWPHHLKRISSMQSKRRNLRHTGLHRETNEKLSFYCYSPRWITTTFSTNIKNIFIAIITTPRYLWIFSPNSSLWAVDVSVVRFYSWYFLSYFLSAH